MQKYFIAYTDVMFSEQKCGISVVHRNQRCFKGYRAKGESIFFALFVVPFFSLIKRRTSSFFDAILAYASSCTLCKTKYIRHLYVEPVYNRLYTVPYTWIDR